ncbi:MAG: hypothetical protein Ct9H300mP12_10540 [Acidimicrobiales bacterium]|nr:MAG: hypothetical protein Ct9H300mP12_10540 [Acidimicrobiales bacterium]
MPCTAICRHALDPLFTIWTAVNRITRDGELLGPDQRARVADAVAGYTSAAAFVSMEEHDKGTLGSASWPISWCWTPIHSKSTHGHQGHRVLATVVGGWLSTGPEPVAHLGPWHRLRRSGRANRG